MKFNLYILIAVIALLMLCGCASNYKTVYLNAMPYSASALDDSVFISMNASPMVMSSNFRYNNYLLNKNVSLLAVKVKNRTSHPILLNGNTISIKDGIDAKEMADLPSVAQTVHQAGAWYMLWSLLYVNIYTRHKDGSESVSPPIPVGAVIGLGNMATSYSADKKFRNDMFTNHLLGRTIDVNEEVTGYIAVKGILKNTVSIKYIENTTN
jgi:hypothetical protein